MTVKDYRADFVHAPFSEHLSTPRRLRRPFCLRRRALDASHARCSAGYSLRI
jgi:hypothetical protein